MCDVIVTDRWEWNDSSSCSALFVMCLSIIVIFSGNFFIYFSSDYDNHHQGDNADDGDKKKVLYL
jgi:hypothetical protein